MEQCVPASVTGPDQPQALPALSLRCSGSCAGSSVCPPGCAQLSGTLTTLPREKRQGLRDAPKHAHASPVQMDQLTELLGREKAYTRGSREALGQGDLPPKHTQNTTTSLLLHGPPWSGQPHCSPSTRVLSHCSPHGSPFKLQSPMSLLSGKPSSSESQHPGRGP